MGLVLFAAVAAVVVGLLVGATTVLVSYALSRAELLTGILLAVIVVLAVWGALALIKP